MWDILLFIPGFVLLVKGADLLVDGAASIASRFGVSNLVIGLTIVAFGTSAPEFVVNLIASLQGKSALVFGNIAGSNIANLLLILGIAGIIVPLKVHRTVTYREIPFSMLAALVLIIMVMDPQLEGHSPVITRAEGLLLLAFFSIFLYYIFSIGFASSGKSLPEEPFEDPVKTPLAILYIILGLAGLTFGGDWIVSGAIVIAKLFGLSDSLIGLTIVAIGTSLPELATSVAAARKRKVDLIIGNVIGSNIFNIFWVLGVSAFASPVFLTTHEVWDLGVVAGGTLLIFLFLFYRNTHTIFRWQGVLLLFFYFAYIFGRIIENFWQT